jgi:hypothetical protein
MTGKNNGKARHARRRRVERPEKDRVNIRRLADALGGLIADLFDYLAWRREVAQREGVFPPPFIRDVDDLEKIVKLHLLLLDEIPLPAVTPTKQDEHIEKALAADPKAREVLADLFRRVHRAKLEDDDKTTRR